MPILLVFALTAACLPIEWPAPLTGGGRDTAAWFTGCAVLLSISMAFVLRTWVVRTIRLDPSRKVAAAHTYSRLRRLMFFFNIALVVACVVVFGWGWLTQQSLVVEWKGETHLAPFGELAVPLPYFVILLSVWLIYYDAERAIHQTTTHGTAVRTFWTRSGYFFNHLRQFCLLAMLPVMLFVTQQTVARYLPETSNSDWYRASTFAVVPLLILFMPILIKPLLGLKPLPPGPVRDRITALAKRLHFRCTDLLLWPTHSSIANAMIVGLLPRVRYVIFTDRIIEELPPEELDAVFGHEVGHAKHGHIWLYGLFLSLSISVLAAGMLLLAKHLDASEVQAPEWARGWLALPPLLCVVSYIFVVFGFLSRRCERQADVYGCRAVSCSDPLCQEHTAETALPERGRGLCPTGIRTCIRALQRVELVNGNVGFDEQRSRSLAALVKGLFKWFRHWQHSTMPRRMAFLGSLIGDPARERRFQRSMLALRWGVIVMLVAALYCLGNAVGWRELLQSM